MINGIKLIFKAKHIGLSIGLFLMTICYFFFAVKHEFSIILYLIGILLSFTFFLSIMLGKESIRVKALWLIITIFLLVIHVEIIPFFVKNSYLIYLYQNQKELILINRILSDKKEDISIMNDDILDKNSELTQVEKDSLIQLKKQIGVYMIAKSKNHIYYGIWGFLDERGGIAYCKNDEKPKYISRHLKGDWYY